MCISIKIVSIVIFNELIIKKYEEIKQILGSKTFLEQCKLEEVFLERR
jgi:hypothetical protein